MKTEEIPIEKPRFTPVRIAITINTEEEFMALWHRLNMGSGYIASNYRDMFVNSPELYLRHNLVDECFRVFDAIRKKAGIDILRNR